MTLFLRLFTVVSLVARLICQLVDLVSAMVRIHTLFIAMMMMMMAISHTHTQTDTPLLRYSVCVLLLSDCALSCCLQQQQKKEIQHHLFEVCVCVVRSN